MTAQRIDPRRPPSEVRRVNRDLLAQFIGADPYGRRPVSPRASRSFPTTGTAISVRVERKTRPLRISQAVPADAGSLLGERSLI